MSLKNDTDRRAIGISLPIRNAGVGFFEQTFDTFEQTKINIINLLRTKRGERRMQPLFGCRLYDVVFEQNTGILEEYIINLIRDDIASWIPNVTINKTDVKFFKNELYNNIDSYKIYVSVNFTVNSTNKTDNIDVVINTNKL